MAFKSRRRSSRSSRKRKYTRKRSSRKPMYTRKRKSSRSSKSELVKYLVEQRRWRKGDAIKWAKKYGWKDVG